MVYLYILESLKDGKHYTGIALDPSVRLKEHNHGKNRFTKAHSPWKIIYTEMHPDWKQAREREKYFKSAAGRKKLKTILAGNF